MPADPQASVPQSRRRGVASQRPESMRPRPSASRRTATRPRAENRLSLRWPRGDAVVWVPRRARAAAPEAELMTAGATTESREKTRVSPAPIVVEVRGSRPDADELDVDVEIAANAD